jgi:hypothetical protein
MIHGAARIGTKRHVPRKKSRPRKFVVTLWAPEAR